jgi:hypothetical protein
METKYKTVNETSYTINTNDKVIEVLERCKSNRKRIIVDYGNVETKESWNEVYDVTGYVGRSTGDIKIPLLVYNRRSIGGGSISTDCILSIKESKGKRVLFSL